MKALWLAVCVVGVTGCAVDIETGEDGAGGSPDGRPGVEPQAVSVSCEEACAAGFRVFRAFCNSKHVPQEKKQLCWRATNDYTAACVKEKAVPGCAPSCGMGYLVFARFCEASLNTKKCEKVSRLCATKCLHPED